MPTSLLRSLAGGFLLTGIFTSAAPAGAQTLQYPTARKSDVADDYHGTRVPDPYRWLEDPDSPESRAWIEAQNRLTAAYLAEIPARATIRQRLTKLWNYPKYGAPFRKAGRYFFLKNDGLQNQSVLYKQASLEATPETLLDPNVLCEDGTVAVSTLAVSDNGRLLAYGTAASGSDWEEFRVRDVVTARDLPDHLKWIKFSGASWTKDGAGFFYSRYPEPTDKALTDVNRFQRLYYHRLGTDQAQDVLVYERPDQPDWGMNAEVTDDGRPAVLTVWLGRDRRTRVYFRDLKDPRHPKITGEVVRLLDDFDASYAFVGNDGPVFYFLTDLDAPRKRVIAIDTRHPERGRWRELIPQGQDVLEGGQIIHDTFVANYMHDASSRLRLFALDGRMLKDLELPTLGSIGSISGGRKDDQMFYAFTSFLYPTTIFRYDFKSGATSVFKAPTIDFEPSRYETKQVFYTSKDGTRVPMFITYKKGLTLDGSNPTYLYGYGGLNISLTPSLSVAMLVWLEMGGVYAVPNLRGGGGYGEEWRPGGMDEKKPDGVDDIISAAEDPIAQRYTAPAKLAIAGGANSGLRLGAALAQPPRLVCPALAPLGVCGMLRFHKFTIGWAWGTDYGSADSAAQVPYLFKYSPLHNIRAGTRYPATLGTTADHDDRVVPGHSFKFTATLQAAQAGPPPGLIWMETKAGPRAWKPPSKETARESDQPSLFRASL